MAEEIKSEIVKGDGRSSWGVIHEEFAKYEKEGWCFRRHETSFEAWQKMTGDSELRFWKARGVYRGYTPLGYMVCGHSRRRWGDGVKVLDRWHVVKVGTAFTPVYRKLDEVLASH